VDAVHAHAEQLAAGFLELVGRVRERHELGRAHEGEVERVEHQHEPLALVVFQADVLDLAFEGGLAGEGGGGLSDDAHGVSGLDGRRRVAQGM
jgi:hypothetical protein